MKRLYDTREAAEYLGLSVSGVKYHIYKARDLKPARYIGRSPVFFREQLDEFEENRRGPGRPRKDSETRRGETAQQKGGKDGCKVDSGKDEG